MPTDEGVQYETPIQPRPGKCYGCDRPHGVGEGYTSFVEPDPEETTHRFVDSSLNACQCVECGTVNYVRAQQGRWSP